MGVRHLLTNSMRNKFASCHRAFKFCYEDLIRPVKASDALSFGTAMHAMLELLERAGCRRTTDGRRLHRRDTLKALFDGYCSKWRDEDKARFDFVAAEVGFEAPLMNPRDGSALPHLAARRQDRRHRGREVTGKCWIVEHKTTGQDIGPGSGLLAQDSHRRPGVRLLRWRAVRWLPGHLLPLRRHPQAGHQALQGDPAREAEIQQGRKPLQPCRLADELPEEWGRDLRAGTSRSARTSTSPAWRCRVPRTTSPNTCSTCGPSAGKSRTRNASGRFSRNPQACSVFGSCEYFDVCTGCASLDDVTLFRKAETSNEELESNKLDMKKVNEIFEKKEQQILDAKFAIYNTLIKGETP